MTLGMGDGRHGMTTYKTRRKMTEGVDALGRQKMNNALSME